MLTFGTCVSVQKPAHVFTTAPEETKQILSRDGFTCPEEAGRQWKSSSWPTQIHRTETAGPLRRRCRHNLTSVLSTPNISPHHVHHISTLRQAKTLDPTHDIMHQSTVCSAKDKFIKHSEGTFKMDPVAAIVSIFKLSPPFVSVSHIPTNTSPSTWELTGWWRCTVPADRQLMLHPWESPWRRKAPDHVREKESVVRYWVAVEMPAPWCGTGAAVTRHSGHTPRAWSTVRDSHKGWIRSTGHRMLIQSSQTSIQDQLSFFPFLKAGPDDTASVPEVLSAGFSSQEFSSAFQGVSGQPPVDSDPSKRVSSKTPARFTPHVVATAVETKRVNSERKDWRWKAKS